MNFREKIKCVVYQGWVWEQVLMDLVTEFRIMERAWTLEPKENGIQIQTLPVTKLL